MLFWLYSNRKIVLVLLIILDSGNWTMLHPLKVFYFNLDFFFTLEFNYLLSDIFIIFLYNLSFSDYVI